MTSQEGDRHDRPRNLLGLEPDDAELLRRLDDVLDRVDPVPDHVTAAAKAAYAAPANPAVPAYGRTDPRPESSGRGTVPLTSNAKSGQGQRPDASTGVPRAPVEVRPAGGATGPTPAAPPAHHLRLTPRQRVLQRLLDLIGRKA